MDPWCDFPGLLVLALFTVVMCTHPFAREALTLHLARREGHERGLSENANGAARSNPRGVLKTRGDQPTRHWLCDRRPRPVPKLGPFEIDHKSAA